MDKLKPCPFCGKGNIGIEKIDFAGMITFAVFCKACQAKVEHYTKERAIKAWNKREDTNA